MSITADPPQLAVAVNRSNASFEAITASRVFAINVLSHDHADIAERFAGGAKGDDRFAAGRWGELATGAPVLFDSAAIFDCRLVQTVAFSSHVLFIGEVEAIQVTPTSTPLLYMDGTWASLVRASEADFAAYERVIQDVENAMDHALSASPEPSRQLADFTRAFAAISVESIDVLRDFFSRETFAPANRLEQINRRKRRVEVGLRALLERGAAAGDFVVSDPAATAIAIIGLLNSVHRRPDVTGADQRDAVGQHFSELIASMVSSRAA